MKARVMVRKGSTVTLDQVPTSLQAGDMVQTVSPGGKVRGRKRKSWLEYVPLFPGAMIAVWYGLNFYTIRCGWLLAVGIILLFPAVMVMTLSMDDGQEKLMR